MFKSGPIYFFFVIALINVSVQVVESATIKLQGVEFKQVIVPNKEFEMTFSWLDVPNTYYNRTSGIKFDLNIENCKINFITDGCGVYPPMHLNVIDGNNVNNLFHDRVFKISVGESKIFSHFVDTAGTGSGTQWDCKLGYNEKLVPGQHALNISLTGDVHQNVTVTLVGNLIDLTATTTTLPSHSKGNGGNLIIFNDAKIFIKDLIANFGQYFWGFNRTVHWF